MLVDELLGILMPVVQEYRVNAADPVSSISPF